MNNNYEWGWQLRVPATEGVRTAGVPPALSVVSRSRATLNGIPPQQAYGHPNLARVDGQNPIHCVGYPIQQVECGHFMGSPPILAPQPAGAADAKPYIQFNGQGGVDMLSNDRWSGAPFESHGAFAREILEAQGGGGAKTFMDVGCAGCVYESWLSARTTSTAAAVEYGGLTQQEFLLNYTRGVYEPQTPEYIEQNGRGGEFEFCQS